MRFDWPNLLAAAAIGALIGFATSFYFSAESSKELQQESEKMRRLNEIMLQGMEQAGWMKLARDPQGHVIGMLIEIGGTAMGESSGTATLTVGKGGH